MSVFLSERVFMKKLFLTLIILLLSACGTKNPDGTYSSNANKESFTFHPNGSVTENISGAKVAEYPYTASGDKIQIGSFVTLTLIKDGTGDLDGGLMFGRLIKK